MTQGPWSGKGSRWGLGEGTDQHEEKDEGHDVGHVGHRLQDDADDPGQRFHRHADVHQTKRPAAQPLRGAPRPLPGPSSPLPPDLPRGAEMIPTPSLSRGPDRFPSFPRVPGSPERIGDGVDTEFINEEPQEQGKDDKEVEDVPAVLGVVGDGGWASPKGVYQAQPVGTSRVCPPTTPRMEGSVCLSGQDQSSAIHCCYFSCCLPKCATKPTSTCCLICVSTAKCSLRDTQWRPSHTQLTPKLSTHLG